MELRAAERDNLISKARKAGIEFVDVLHRERIRILLDSPDGLAARYQYLGIALSEEEQAAFFARWGNQLEQIIIECAGAAGTRHSVWSKLRAVHPVHQRAKHRKVWRHGLRNVRCACQAHRTTDAKD